MVAGRRSAAMREVRHPHVPLLRPERAGGAEADYQNRRRQILQRAAANPRRGLPKQAQARGVDVPVTSYADDRQEPEKNRLEDDRQSHEFLEF